MPGESLNPETEHSGQMMASTYTGNRSYAQTPYIALPDLNCTKREGQQYIQQPLSLEPNHTQVTSIDASPIATNDTTESDPTQNSNSTQRTAAGDAIVNEVLELLGETHSVGIDTMISVFHDWITSSEGKKAKGKAKRYLSYVLLSAFRKMWFVPPVSMGNKHSPLPTFIYSLSFSSLR